MSRHRPFSTPLLLRSTGDAAADRKLRISLLQELHSNRARRLFHLHLSHRSRPGGCGQRCGSPIVGAWCHYRCIGILSLLRVLLLHCFHAGDAARLRCLLCVGKGVDVSGIPKGVGVWRVRRVSTDASFGHDGGTITHRGCSLTEWRDLCATVTTEDGTCFEW